MDKSSECTPINCVNTKGTFQLLRSWKTQSQEWANPTLRHYPFPATLSIPDKQHGVGQIIVTTVSESFANLRFRSYERTNARGTSRRFVCSSFHRLFLGRAFRNFIADDSLVLEWQLDNNGQPLQDSEESEGSQDLDEPNIKPSVARGPKAQLSRGPSRPNAKHTTSGHKARAHISAHIHKDRHLKNTFSVERDSDAKAAWRIGQPWTGQ